MASAHGTSHQPPVSRRVTATDPPIVVATKRIMAAAPGSMSLAQGIVYWDPPAAAVEAASQAVRADVHALSQYGPDEGLPALREALRRKLVEENGLHGYDVLVTAGANQAFTNTVIALLDECDACVLFAPIYFNHRMALQMTGGGDRVVLGPCHPDTLHPDLDWLERQLAGPRPPKMVVLTNPCNPTGVLLQRAELQRAADLCAAAGAWLICDNTYEHFVYGSWADGSRRRFEAVGYIAYQEGGDGSLAAQLLKVQDTNAVCAGQLNQQLALGALQQGRAWVDERVAALAPNREAVLAALEPLGTLGLGVAGGDGAIYLWARLPPGCEDDHAVIEWLVRKHGVCVIPGTACGTPGHIRVAYANLPPEATAEAARRLRAGLEELVAGGFCVVQAWLDAHRLQA